MEKAIVEVKAEDFGLDVTKAQEIELGFSPAINKLNELKPAFDLVIQKEISPETCKEAKELRLQFVKVRTETDKIHKAFKAFYLAGGRFVDAWKNKQKEISEQVEGKLKEIEEHYERIEQRKREERKVLRLAELAKIEHTEDGLDVLNMEPELWECVLIGMQTEYNNRKEAEAKEKAELEAKEEVERVEQERIKQENAKLKEQLAKERAEQAKKEAAERAKAEAEEKEKQEVLKQGDIGKIKLYFSALSKEIPDVQDKELKLLFGSILSLIDNLVNDKNK